MKVSAKLGILLFLTVVVAHTLVRYSSYENEIENFNKNTSVPHEVVEAVKEAVKEAMKELAKDENENEATEDAEEEDEDEIKKEASEDAKEEDEKLGADEVIRSVFNDDRYLRVCAPVFLTTTLCITVRYPFPVTPPPSSGPNLRKVDQRYFDLKDLVIVDADKLHPYRSLPATDEEVKKCLDAVAAKTAENETNPSPFSEGEPSVAVAVFTRQKKGEDHFSFFGTRSEDQLHRVSKFYPDGSKVVLYGDSNIAVGSVSGEITRLWDHCMGAPNFANEVRLYCNGPLEQKDQVRRRAGSVPWDKLDHSKVFITKLGNTDCHQNITAKLLDFAEILKDPNANSLQQMNVIVQHPIAHVARQPDLLDAFDQTRAYQDICIKNLVEAMSQSSKAALAEAGFELKHVVVFDGLTQHFPTETGAFTPELKTCFAGEACDDLPGWNMEQHGPVNCAGPIPKTSLYRKFLEAERIQYMEHGFDMRWYGMSWEFTNLFWWQHKAWDSKRGLLDCTHNVQRGGGVSMYRYFVQAMIDDYYSP